MTFTTAYIVLGCAAFAVLFAELSGIPQYVAWWLAHRYKFFRKYRGLVAAILGDSGRDWNPRRLKPFDCAMCLAFWITLTWFSVHDPQPENLLHAAVASVTAYFITKLIKK